jgi:predicted nucleotidyltransferase
MDDLPAPVMTLAQALAGCRGVVGVVLGGSRARGRNAADADFDLGLYYGKDSFGWTAVTTVLKAHDDSGEPAGLAPPGAWGGRG